MPAEVLKHGGPGIIDALTVVCQKIWTSGQWPKNWTQSLIIPLPKEGNTTFSKLQNNQPDQSPKQDHATSDSKQASKPGRTGLVKKNKCYRIMLDVSNRKHKTIEYVWQQVNILVGRQQFLRSTIRRHKLSRFGHTLPKIVLHGRTYGSRGRGRPCKSWKGNLKESMVIRCRHCCISWMTEVNGHSSQWMHLSEYPKRRLDVTSIKLGCMCNY